MEYRFTQIRPVRFRKRGKVNRNRKPDGTDITPAFMYLKILYLYSKLEKVGALSSPFTDFKLFYFLYFQHFDNLTTKKAW